jgi:hypothetical protein
MTVKMPPICLYCAHYQGIPTLETPDVVAARKPNVGRCTAFGDAPIPSPIWNNGADHRQPYDGDNGVQFQPR